MIWATVKMILALGTVLAVLFLLVRLCKRTGIGTADSRRDNWIRLLTTRPIAPHKYISLVEIGEEVLVLGIAESQITLLDKIADRRMAEKIAASRFARPESLSWLENMDLARFKFWNGSRRISSGK